MSADSVESRPLHKYPVKSGRDILEGQYRSGRGVLDKSDWAREAFDSLRKRCPHVPEETLVRLFHDKSQSQLELIQGEAVFQEYNSTHPFGRRRVKVRARPAPKVDVRSVPASRPAPRAAPKPAAKKAAAKPKARPAKAARKAAPAKRRK